MLASSTMIATTVRAIARTAATISPALERVVAAAAGFGRRIRSITRAGSGLLDASAR